MSIQTVLFDLDGTIIDSNELIIASFDYTFEKYNYSFTVEEIASFNGPPLRDTFHNINPELADEMVETYRDHNLSVHDEYVKVFPNVMETIGQLKDAGIKVGIVTSKMRRGVNQALELTGLNRFFETVVTIDDVTNPKPHPESVIKAMNELNGQIESSLMIGDNYHDIGAGQNAGMQTAGVAWSSKGRDYLQQYNPTYMLEDMKDLLKIVGV